MPEFSKNELDRLFQQGAERYDFDYNPAAWKQMAARLDRSRRRRALLWWLAGLGALLLAGLVFLLFLRDPVALTHATEPGPVPATPGLPPFESKASETEEPGLRLPNPQDTVLKAGVLTPNQRKQPPIIKSGEKIPLQASAPRSGRKKNKVAETPPTQQQQADAKTESAAPLQKIEGQPAPERDIMEIPELLRLLSPTLSMHETARDIRGLPGASSWTSQENSSRRLVAGVGCSAGLNSVGWGDFSRSGWKAGIFAEYQYNSRFAIGLGASFLRMNYLAGKGEYIPPKGFWTRRIAPDNTRGLCNILEVPVMLKYYHRGYSGSGFFASAGISSYLMLMEEYWYRYTLEDPDLIRWWQTGKDQGYWFALGQLSAGYQARLGERWALQLGANLQAPISGVGHGQVKIYSLGLDVRLLRSIW